MSLVSILLIAVALLAFLSGLIFLVGSSKADRVRGFWIFMLGISCMVWTAGCGIFLALPTTASEITTLSSIMAIYIGGIVLSFSVLVYAAWWCTANKKFGIACKVYVVICGLMALFLVLALTYDRNLLYTGVTLSNSGNSVQIYWGWYYITCCIYQACCFLGFLLCQYLNAGHARLRRTRTGGYVLFFGFLIASILSGVFNLLLPPVNYALIWVGPLSLSVVLIAFFYTALKFRTISVSTRWLQVLAYAVTILAGVVVYMMIFYLVFTTLFKIPNPSASILVLNFLMIVIVLLLVPVINEVNAALKTMISVGQVDIAYVIKKLNKLVAKNIDLRELASFLADHLHFAYIGFVINGRLYGSKALAVSADELAKITKLKPAPGNGVWQEPTKDVQKILDELNLKAVAELKNAKGKAFGQLIVGKPNGKMSFERRDLVQLEMIINLVAAVVDSEKHIRA